LLGRRYPASPLIWAQPTPALAADPLCLRGRVGFHPRGRVSQITGSTFRCALSPTTPAGPEAARARCFASGSRLHHLWEPGRLRFGVSRPNRVRLRYGSHLRRAESPAGGSLPSTAPRATCLTGHYTAASFHAARLARFTGGTKDRQEEHGGVQVPDEIGFSFASLASWRETRSLALAGHLTSRC
jgi:hypothetical protein